MDVFQAIRTVLAVRAFKDQPVPDATIRKIVEAAHLSASSMNMQPWHFVVVQERDTLKQIGSALLATVLWPLILLGINLHIH